MRESYFQRVTAQTPTRFWINNPSSQDLEQAIAAGAIGCTTNPAYCAKLLLSEPGYIDGLVDRVAREMDDVDRAADRVYRIAAARIVDRLRPMYDASSGTRGFVTLQADPREDEDTDCIVAAALRYRELGPNFMTKIPVTPAGLAAIESIVAHNIPICATEVFAISQAIRVCELYQRACARTGNHPPFYVTHISGIFDQYLGEYARSRGVDISPEVLGLAGCAIGRKQYQLLKQRGYDAILLGGGARGTQHFTEFVGGEMHITINWSTAQTLIEEDGPVVSRIGTMEPTEIIEELDEKLPDFSKAYHEDGLTPDEYADFGPLQLFRNMFLDGHGQLLAQLSAHRGPIQSSSGQQSALRPE